MGKTCKIVISETTRPRALKWGMLHNLVNVYQVCSNYAPVAINGPVPGSYGLQMLVYV